MAGSSRLSEILEEKEEIQVLLGRRGCGIPKAEILSVVKTEESPEEGKGIPSSRETILKRDEASQSLRRIH